jgi:hypothetical protein
VHTHSNVFSIEKGEATMSTPNKLTWYGKIGWIGLILLGIFPLSASIADLSQDLRGAIPADHVPTFMHAAHESYTAFSRSDSGAARYVHLLETGYAIHELVFGLLFLAIVLWPLRRGQWWAWGACWAVLIADITYSLTFGASDSTIFARSLAADSITPICLLLVAVSFVRSRHKYS